MPAEDQSSREKSCVSSVKPETLASIAAQLNPVAPWKELDKAYVLWVLADKYTHDLKGGDGLKYKRLLPKIRDILPGEDFHILKSLFPDLPETRLRLDKEDPSNSSEAKEYIGRKWRNEKVPKKTDTILDNIQLYLLSSLQESVGIDCPDYWAEFESRWFGFWSTSAHTKEGSLALEELVQAPDHLQWRKEAGPKGIREPMSMTDKIATIKRHTSYWMIAPKLLDEVINWRVDGKAPERKWRRIRDNLQKISEEGPISATTYKRVVVLTLDGETLDQIKPNIAGGQAESPPPLKNRSKKI